MYNNVATPAMAGSGAGLLATTGSWAFWYFLAAFALLAAGAALLRIVPRFNNSDAYAETSLDEVLWGDERE